MMEGGPTSLTPLRMPVPIECIEQAPCITCPYESKCSLTGVVSPLSCPWICEWVVKEFREITNETAAQEEEESPSQKRLLKRVAASAR